MANLKITFLTQTVLDSFSRRFDVSSLTDEQARQTVIEENNAEFARIHLAYCACMSACGVGDSASFARKLFLELVDHFMGISLTLKEVYG